MLCTDENIKKKCHSKREEKVSLNAFLPDLTTESVWTVTGTWTYPRWLELHWQNSLSTLFLHYLHRHPQGLPPTESILRHPGSQGKPLLHTQCGVGNLWTSKVGKVCCITFKFGFRGLECHSRQDHQQYDLICQGLGWFGHWEQSAISRKETR